MAGLPPGDPKLVSMIVNHLKSQGLFDQFRRDCLADVDTKNFFNVVEADTLRYFKKLLDEILRSPAYLNLRQRVDNFVSNHLSNHTWSPHLNKNQLRNNIRQLVLQSGMLEAGVDRIITQVVDPKIHHKFKPQVERVVHDYLTSINQKESDQLVSSAQIEEKQDYFIATPGTSSGPSTTVASDAMSILDTITSLNQEASAAWASTESIAGKSVDRTARRSSSQIADGGLEKDKYLEDSLGKEKADLEEAVEESCAVEETPENALQASKDAVHTAQETSDPIEPSKETAEKSEDPENMSDKREEEKEKNVSKTKEAAAAAAAPTEKEGEEQKAPSEKHIIKQKARERLKEEYSLEDSDLEGLSDISVSSVHTSDLSSFDEESEEEPPLSDSTEEGEITSEDEEYQETKTNSIAKQENEDRKPRAGRQAYVHKPFLYSKYYSDSDDEVTVEQRRRSIAKDKEERLLKRQQNREKLEERRKHKAAEKGKHQEALHSLEQDKVQRKTGTVSPSSDSQGASVKEALKEQKVLEKKVAISRRRKRNSRKDGDDGTSQKRKREPEDEFKEILKKAETQETYAKEPKPSSSKSQLLKPVRRLSESVQPAEESKHEHRRKRSGSTVSTSPQAEETTAEAGELKEPKKLPEKVKVHSFLSDLDPSYDESYKQRVIGKNEKHLKKETISDAETESGKKKEVKHPKEKSEKERSLLDDKVKHKSKSDKAQKAGDVAEHHVSEGKGMENLQKDSGHQAKAASDEKSDRKSKVKNDRKCSTSFKDIRLVISEATSEDVLHKDGTRKVKISLTEQPKAEQKVKGDRSSVRSDTKVQLSAGCSLKENPVFQNKVESSSEDRSDIELGSESGRKKEKLLKDIKKRSKSYSDDRHAEKVRSRAENKEAKASDKEGLGPESKSKVDQSSKDSHNTEKSHLGADVDRKSKDSDSCLEVKAATESESETSGRSVSSSQRDSSHKFKAEKPASKSAKVTSSSKTEKKSQGTEHKSKSAKPSHRLETLKERKKESGIKEEKKASVEKSQVKTKEDIQEMENEQESKEVKKTVDKKFSIKEIESDKRKGSTSVLQVSDSLTDVSEQEGSTTEGSSTSPQDIEVADNLTSSVQENVPVDMDVSLTGTHGSAASETSEPGQGASVCRSESDHSGLEGEGKPTEIISKTVSAKDNNRAPESVDTVSCETAASDLTLELEAKTPVAAVPVVGGTGSGQEMKEAEAESSKQDTLASKEIEVELGDPAPVPEDETNEEASKTIEEEESATPVEIKYNQEGEVDHVDQQEAATEGVCKEERKEVQSTGDVSVHEELPIINLPSSDSLTNIKQRTEQPAPVSIQEHEEPDMKTKEAALALLSMDPQIPAQVEKEETQTQLLTEAIPPVMHDAQQETSLMEADVGGLSSTQKSDIIPGNECLGAAEHKESALLAGELEQKKEDTGEMIKVEPSLGTDKTEEPPEKDTAHKDEATNESESIEKDKGTSGTTSQDKQEAEIKDPSKEGKTPRRGRPPKNSAARVKDTADGQVSGHHVETKMGEKKDSPLISPDEGNTDIPLDKDKTDHTESSERNPATETGTTCSKLEATEETEMSAETSVEENKPEGLEKETSQENEPKRAQWQQLQTTGDEGQQCLGQELEMKEGSKESEIKSDNGKAETTDKKRRGRGRPKRVSVSSEPMLVKEEEAERKVESAEKLEESKESDQSENEKRTAGAEMPTEEPSLVKGAGEPSVNKDETGEAEDQISDQEEERKSARRGRPSGKHTKKEDDEKEERKKDDVDEKEQNSDLSEPEDELVEDKRPLRRGRSSETPARAKGTSTFLQTSKQSKSDKEHIMDQSEDEENSEKVRETKPCKGRHSKPGKETSKTPKEENKDDDDQKFESDEESEKETKPPRRGRSSKQSSTPLKETGKSSKEKEEEKAENSGDEKKSEKVEKKTPVRRGRRSAAQGKETGNQDEAEEKPGVDSDQKQDEKEDERTEQKIPGRRGRPPKQLSKETDKPSKMQNEEKDRQTPDADSKDEEEPENDSKVTKRGRAKCPPKESKDTSKSTRKRKRSEESEESDDENEPEKAEDQKPAPKKRPPKRACSDSGSPTEEQGDEEEEDDEEEEESTNDTKARNDEDKEKTMEKKNVRLRSSKGSPAEEKQDLDKKDKKTELEGKEDEEGDDDDEDDEEEREEEEEETQIRATTRSASRLEAERNKPSKPPTRAVRKLDTSDSVREKPSTSAKEKASPALATATRSRVQPSPASKQGRKRETSPPVVRTRGGQKTEEPPSKRTKR